MLDIKARQGYMGNPQGEGAIWQRTPSGIDVKVGTDSFKKMSLCFLILCCAVESSLRRMLYSKDFCAVILSCNTGLLCARCPLL